MFIWVYVVFSLQVVVWCCEEIWLLCCVSLLFAAVRLVEFCFDGENVGLSFGWVSVHMVLSLLFVAFNLLLVFVCFKVLVEFGIYGTWFGCFKFRDCCAGYFMFVLLMFCGCFKNGIWCMVLNDVFVMFIICA